MVVVLSLEFAEGARARQVGTIQGTAAASELLRGQLI